MDRLNSGQTLGPGESLTSVYQGQEGWFRFMLFSNGDPVIYRVQTHREIWIAPHKSGAARSVHMQNDGNLVATSESGQVVWSTQTAGNPGAIARLKNDGNLVVEAEDGRKLWASNSGQDLKSPTIVYSEATGYHFTETSESWKEFCEPLPCFLALRWPGYASGIVEDTVDGHPIVIQWWKGLCPKFLGLVGVQSFPGGVGAEVGIYRRFSGRQRPTSLAFLPKPLEAAAVAIMRAAPDRDLWWPYPELGARVEFTLTNPKTKQLFFEARSQKTFWQAKWMDESSYLRYQKEQGKRWKMLPAWIPGNSRTPANWEDYVLRFRVNGKTYPDV
jgi:frataxin-like iron-binding protein CyaY